MTTIPKTTVDTAVLTCPACHVTVYASVLVDLSVGNISAPDLDQIKVEVDSKIIGLAVNHRCGGAEVPPEAADNHV